MRVRPRLPQKDVAFARVVSFDLVVVLTSDERSDHDHHMYRITLRPPTLYS
jgi:hypothetical protein